jgi:8-oxo-dGTP pyrophosphatase MutT (NUDIX family)
MQNQNNKKHTNWAMLSDEDNLSNQFTGWNSFKKQLSKRLSGQLPGKTAQYKLAPLHRLAEDEYDAAYHRPVESSVLMLLFTDNGRVYLPVILRNEYNGAHSGQISLPGGRKENQDISDYSTALRETFEEIGVKSGEMVYCGKLTDLYIPRSNFLVHPFVAAIDKKPLFDTDPKEVKELLILKLDDLLAPDAVIEKKLKIGNISIVAPGFDAYGHFMWGATAMIFSEFIEIVKKITYPD